MKINFNNFVNYNKVNLYSANSVQSQNVQRKIPNFTGEDSFVKSTKADDIYVKKLEQLFPNGSLHKIYDAINKEFGIDKPATLKLYGSSDGVQAGGFTFSKNEIGMSMQEFVDNNYKVVGIKNGKKFTIMTPDTKLPLFATKELCEQFVNAQQNPFKAIFDKLEVEPISQNEQRKFVIQRLAHEIIHSQQHMVMRQTSDIGEIEIEKAWTHYIPKTQSDVENFNKGALKYHQTTYWGTQEPTARTIPANSQIGQLAHIWLESVRNYPAVDSPAYKTNAIEVDAYNRSYDYVVQRFGKY